MKDVVGGGVSGAAAGLNMIVKVNGEAFAYDEFELPAEVKAVGRTFTNFVLGDIALKAGENTITLPWAPTNPATALPAARCLIASSSAPKPDWK